MNVLILIFIILLSLQIVLALFAWGLRRELEKKYSFATGEGKEPAEVIEEYYKDGNTKFRIIASDEIVEPAFAESDLLIINKNKIYKKDLYTNFYIIFQAELTKSDYKILRILGNFQSFVFILEIAVFVLANTITTNFKEIILYVAIAIQIFSFILTLIGFIQIDGLLDDTMTISKSLLKLDDVEEARALGLKSDLRYSVFEYPFEVVWRIVQFLR
ncbi:MAG: hypothetical protein ABI721_00820 [Candidatus Dojkabacteria bacterium]